MFPIRCDTAWTQPTKPGCAWLPWRCRRTIPAALGKFHSAFLDLDGKKLGEFRGKNRNVSSQWEISNALSAQWPNDVAIPGAHHLLGIVYDKSGKELSARRAPYG
jgi:hypothetical protein